MSIAHWDLDRADALAPCYNRHVADLPGCYPVAADDFAWHLGRELRYFYGPLAPLRDEQCIVWREGGEITGFIHVAIGPKEKDPPDVGLIRFLGYPPDRRAQGQVLLDAADEYFRQQGVAQIKAFSKGRIYPFCSADGGYSDRHGHILGLLQANGYAITGRKVDLVWSNFALAAAPEPPSDALCADGGPLDDIGDLPNLNFELHDPNAEGEDSVGECYTYSLGYLQRAAQAQDQLYINWLSVDPPYQNQGWGRYLLLRTLWEAQQIGYKHSALATVEGNYRALQLYTALGYRITDRGLVFTKDLDGENS